MADAKGDADAPGSTAPLPAGPKPGERDTAFFTDPMIDHLLRAIVTLTMEASVTRERLRTLESLLVESGGLRPGAADNHVPDTAETADRARLRMKLIDDILGPMASRLAKDAAQP
jgi:hypothetical protein